MTENEIATVIVDAAIEVHRTLGGPGLLESIYREALALELTDRGLAVTRERAVPVQYKGRRLSHDLRVDLMVESKVVVECKATAAHNPVFESQALTYLRLLDLRLALVVNFGSPRVASAIRRVVNRLEEPRSTR